MILPDEFTKSEKRTVLAAACLAIFINPMVGSMLNLALPAIGEDLDCSAHQLGWVSSIYFIASVMALMPASKLSDIIGKKRVFSIGLIIAIAGLILSSMSQSIYQLYFFRAFTGMGTAMISCNGVSMISDVYKRHERGVALSLNTACVYLGGSLGPSIGGFATEAVGWRWLFIIIIPLMVLALVCISRFGYNIKTGSDRTLDARGSALYAAGVLMTMIGILSLPELYAVILLVAGIVIMILFIFSETKAKNPIMELHLFKNLKFSKSLTALFLNYAASYSISFFLSLYLQRIGALSPSEAGLVLMVQPLMQVIITLSIGRIIDSLDYRILPTAGMGVLLIGLSMLMFVGSELNLPYVLLCLAVSGVGFGLFSSPNTTATMSYVEPSQYNEASGLIASLRQTGMMMSMGIATLLIAVYMGSTSHLTPENYGVFVDIMHYAWIICIVFCFIGMVFSWFRGKSDADSSQ